MKLEGPLLRSQPPLPDRILSQLNPAHNLISCLLRVHSLICAICYLPVGVFHSGFPIKIGMLSSCFLWIVHIRTNWKKLQLPHGTTLFLLTLGAIWFEWSFSSQQHNYELTCDLHTTTTTTTISAASATSSSLAQWLSDIVIQTHPPIPQNTISTDDCTYGHGMIYMLHPLTKRRRISHECDWACISFKKAALDFKVNLKPSADNSIDFI
jgi:hypothetical protein